MLRRAGVATTRRSHGVPTKTAPSPTSSVTTTNRAFAVVRAFSTTTTSQNDKLNYNVIPKEYFGDYKEYSVIHTNRSLNLMSDPFQQVMRNLNDLLCVTYNANKIAIIPGYVPN